MTRAPWPDVLRRGGGPIGTWARWPDGERAQYSLLALAATPVGVIALVPGLPGPLSALLLVAFVGVAPGSAVLAWTGSPGVARAFVVPALGLAAVVVVTAAASTVGWWSPRGGFAIIALPTLWSVIPNVPVLVRALVP